MPPASCISAVAIPFDASTADDQKRSSVSNEALVSAFRLVAEEFELDAVAQIARTKGEIIALKAVNIIKPD